MIILSCTISYVGVSIVSTILSLSKLTAYNANTYFVSAITSIILIILSIISSFVYQSKFLKNIMVKHFHRNLCDNIWVDLFDLKNGTNLKVYIKEKDYYIIGHYKCHEDKENDNWIAISAFSKYDVETNTAYKEEPDFTNDENVFCVVPFSDIEHIEVFI